jgi:hypothetical protein
LSHTLWQPSVTSVDHSGSCCQMFLFIHQPCPCKATLCWKKVWISALCGNASPEILVLSLAKLPQHRDKQLLSELTTNELLIVSHFIVSFSWLNNAFSFCSFVLFWY